MRGHREDNKFHLEILVIIKKQRRKKNHKFSLKILTQLYYKHKTALFMLAFIKFSNKNLQGVQLVISYMLN